MPGSLTPVKKQAGDWFCENCAMAKTIHAYVMTPVENLERPGTLVYGDEAGKYKPTVGSKYTYAAAFVDAWSRKSSVCPMKPQGEFVRAFNKVLLAFEADGTLIERLSGELGNCDGAFEGPLVFLPP